MLYVNFIQKAKDLCITQDEETEIWYVEPEWIDILHRNDLGDLEDLEDSFITDWLDVEAILKLETKRRNIQSISKAKVVIDWLYDLFTATVDPLLISEENEYVKNVIEYLKTSHQINNESKDEGEFLENAEQ